MMPFPGGIESDANGTLILSVAAAVLYFAMVERPVSWRRTAVKTAAVGLLAVLAFLAGGPVLLVMALALAALGDALLSLDGEAAFLAGLASFLAAHLAAIALFVAFGSGAAVILDTAWRLGLAVALVAFAGLVMARLLPAVGRTLRLPVAAYCLVLLGMALAALTLDRPMVILGAVLFVLSDALLAAERFLLAGSPEMRRPLARAVWVLYYLGQAAITLGLLVPLRS